MAPSIDRVLVIKLGALGDLVQAMGGMAQIRAAHAHARITLLTTEPYLALARASGLFDRIETDGRAKGWRAQLALIRRLRAARYDRVYDLQTADRTAALFYALWPRPPQWSGTAWGASHRQTRRDREALHNLDRLADQLHVAGIAPALAPGQTPPPDLGWAVALARGEAQSTAARFGLPDRFGLLVPGASPGRPEKLWPIDRYGALARWMARAGITPAVVGGPGERAAAQAIAAAEPSTVDLTGRTQVVDLAGLGAEAALCVGNDTGPTHLAAYGGADGLMLMPGSSRPWQYAPRGAMGWLQRPSMAEVTVEAVVEALAVAGLLLAAADDQP